MAGRAEAQGSEASRVLTLINQARVNAGLAPLAVNSQLTTSAQAHADDMSRNGTSIGHNGSDGSTPASRILRAGYRPYSWGPFVGENWAAFQTVDDSMSAWMNDPPHRSNILRREFREIGVGVARSPSGAPILVTDFGAQPNVLPVFLNGTGASVMLTLTNEDAAPQGDGPAVIGRVVRVDISTDADFVQARDVPFTASIPYSSEDGGPVSKVYVRFHDAEGRTAVSAATASGPVALAVGAPSPTSKPTPSRTRLPTRLPTATRMPTLPPPTDTPTPTPTLTSAPTTTPTASETPRVRPLLAASDSAKAQGVPSVEEPMFTPLAEGLFAAAGFLLLLAGATAWQGRRR